MNIDRFDEIEFTVLNCATSGMYIAKDGEYKDRALLLMDLGILKNNPVDKWHWDGWKLTEEGIKYNNEFMSHMREIHGHVWLLNKDTHPDEEDDSEYGNKINTFAYSVGHHNGPECKNCGYSFCQHCTSEFDIPKCTAGKS